MPKTYKYRLYPTKKQKELASPYEYKFSAYYNNDSSDCLINDCGNDYSSLHLERSF